MNKATIAKDFQAVFDWYPTGTQKVQFDKFLGEFDSEVLKKVFDSENGSSITARGVPLLWKMKVLAEEILRNIYNTDRAKKQIPAKQTSKEIEEYKLRSSFFMGEGIVMAKKGATEEKIEAAFKEKCEGIQSGEPIKAEGMPETKAPKHKNPATSEKESKMTPVFKSFTHCLHDTCGCGGTGKKQNGKKCYWFCPCQKCQDSSTKINDGDTP